MELRSQTRGQLTCHMSCVTKGMNKLLLLKSAELKIVEFANSVDPDEVAHDEPPHLYLHCLPCGL